jgi:hypothetical protein
MAAANASVRGQRGAILPSPLHELTGFYLAVDCLARGCNGERTFAIAELASFYGRDCTAGELLRRMRCSRACGGRVGAAWLETARRRANSSLPRSSPCIVLGLNTFRQLCPRSQRSQLRAVILAARRGAMRAYLTAAGMALGLVAVWAALVPLLA